jgi:hypothetical protein
MSNQLQSNIQRLASTFASAVVSAIRTANLDEIVSLSGGSHVQARNAAAVATSSSPRSSAPKASRRGASGSNGRLRRRSKAEIERALGKIVALLKASKRGLRAEEIRVHLKMQSKEMPRVLKEGLAKKALKSKGQRRSTTYSVL